MSAPLLVTIEYEVLHCSSCAFPMHLPSTYVSARRRDHATFWCVNGHTQWFPHETDAERLGKKLQAAEAETERVRTIAMDRGKDIERMKLRTANGVCPCCNRTFKGLAAHMKRKHPDVVK